MKNSEQTTLESSGILEHIELPTSVKENLIYDLDIIKDLLKDNPEFFKKLITKCLFVGKRLEHKIYIDDIGNLIKKEYPDTLKSEDGKKLFKTVGDFVRQLCFNSDELKTITSHNPLSKWGDIRDELDHIVLNYTEIDPIDIGLTGGIFTYEEW